MLSDWHASVFQACKSDLPECLGQVIVNYAAGSARAEEVVAELKSGGGDAVAIGANVGKARPTTDRMFRLAAALLCIKSAHA